MVDSLGIRVLEIDCLRLEVERGGGVLERVRVGVEGAVGVGLVHRRIRERRVGARVGIARGRTLRGI